MLGLYLSLPSRLGWAFWASSLVLRRFCLIWVVSSCCLIEVFMERSWKSCCCCSVCRLSVNRCCSYIRVQKRAISGLCYIHACFIPFRFQVNYLQVLKSSDYVWAVCSDSSFGCLFRGSPQQITCLSRLPVTLPLCIFIFIKSMNLWSSFVQCIHCPSSVHVQMNSALPLTLAPNCSTWAALWCTHV